MRDCRTCKHNTYIEHASIGWFDCSHPTTFEKRVRWEKGDPAMVEYRTADVPISEIDRFENCPTWEGTTAVGDETKINGWEIRLLPEGFELRWEAVAGDFADRFYTREAAERFARSNTPREGTTP